MITKSLLSALESLGFTYAESDTNDKNHAYAIYGGYLVSVYEIGSKKIAYFSFKFSDNEENAITRYDMSESFSAQMEEYSVSDYLISEDGMKVECSGNIPTFLKLIDACISMLIANEIEGATRCSVCGNKFGARNPKKVTIGNDNHIMCEHCAIEAVEQHRNSTASTAAPTQKAHILPGILGSILFSIVGVGIYFVLYYWLSPAVGDTGFEIRYLFGAAGFIVSLLAYVGYRLFCKRVSLSAYITISVCSVVFAAIGQYIGSVFEYIAKGGFALSNLKNSAFWFVHLRNTTPAEVTDVVIPSDVFYVFLTVSLLFAAVGAAIFLLTLHEKSVPKKENLIVETLNLN